MTQVSKLLFDLSLWFTLSGYFLRLTTGDAPSVWGILALCAAIVLDAALRRCFPASRPRGFLRFLPLILPLLALFARLTLWQAIQLIPIWLYLGWSLLSDRVDVSYNSFRGHFSFALKLLLLLVLGPLFPNRAAAAVVGTIPWLVLTLALGVSLLRALREDRPSGLRQLIYIGIFLLACVFLTAGRAPQMLLKAAGYVWQYALAPLVFLLAIAFAAVFYGGYLLLRWIVLRAQGSSEPLKLDMQGAAQAMGLEDEFSAYTADLRWLRILLIVLGVVALLAILFFVFRRMLGEQARPDKPRAWQVRQGFAPGAAHANRVPKLLRPSDARLAIRFDFARFLAECRRQGFTPAKGMTVSEVASRSAPLFPDASPDELRALYSRARYSSRSPVTGEDARSSAEVLRRLKRSAEPEGKRPREKNRKRP